MEFAARVIIVCLLPFAGCGSKHNAASDEASKSDAELAEGNGERTRAATSTASGENKQPGRDADNDRNHRANPVTKLTGADLANLKSAALAYLRKSKPEKWDVHLEELTNSAIFNDNERHQIGIWMVSIKSEQGNDLIVLAREPELAELVVRYGLVFKRDGQAFVVVRDFWEHETFQ